VDCRAWQWANTLAGNDRADGTGCFGRGQVKMVEAGVLWHSKDRDKVHQKAIDLHPQRFAVLYTGQIPEDAAIVL
jgi:hypothetical protein